MVFEFSDAVLIQIYRRNFVAVRILTELMLNNLIERIIKNNWGYRSGFLAGCQMRISVRKVSTYRSLSNKQLLARNCPIIHCC